MRTYVDETIDGIPRLRSIQKPARAPRERVHSGDRARRELIRGFGQLARALAATFGPLGGHVLVTSEKLNGAPEYIHDAGVLARRILELQDRYETMGAMLARHLAWRTKQEAGDGAATAVILGWQIILEAQRYIAAGYDPMSLKGGLFQAARVAVSHLDALAEIVVSRQQCERLATAHSGDPDIGRIMAEVLDVVGADGVVQIRDYHGRGIDREYVEGARWEAGFVSPHFVTDAVLRIAQLEDPVVAVSDLVITDVQDVVALIDAAIQQHAKGLLLVVADITSAPLSVLTTNHSEGVLPCLVVKAPGRDIERIQLLEDMALLTGARYFGESRGEQLRHLKAGELGHVRRAVASGEAYRIVGPGGDPRRIRAQARFLRQQIRERAPSDPDREFLMQRLAKLAGGIAVIDVGGVSKHERNARKESVSSTLAVMRSALTAGVVPGAGAALLSCAREIEAQQWAEGDRWGASILAKALCEPVKVLAQSGGYSPSTVAAKAVDLAPARGFDVLSGQYVDLCEAGIVDPVSVLKTALTLAVSIAATTCTTQVLVLTRDAESLKKAQLEP